MKKPYVPAVWLTLLALFLQTGCTSSPATKEPTPTNAGPAVRIHFLGHAALILEFDNGVSVLSDYGDASQTGWPVQVFEFGSFQPDIVTYSQTHHMDHYTPMDFAQAKILIGEAELSDEGLEITPVPTHELSMDTFDSCGYLFSYKGLKILNAGEPLQYILNIENEPTRQEIRERYAGGYDLVILPVSGLNTTFPQLESFIGLLNTKRVILMHASSLGFYKTFLTFLEDEHPGEYVRLQADGPEYGLDPAERVSSIIVIGLTPAPYEGTP